MFPAGGDDWLGFDVLRSLAAVVEDATTAQPNSENVEDDEVAVLEVEGDFIEKAELTELLQNTEKDESAMLSSSKAAFGSSDNLQHIPEETEEQKPAVEQEEEPSPSIPMPTPTPIEEEEEESIENKASTPPPPDAVVL